MGLNIKSERTHALVRRLAELTGLSQTGAVEDAVRRRLAELEDESAGRASRADVLLRAIRVELTDAERDALRRASDALYDINGLPR